MEKLYTEINFSKSFFILVDSKDKRQSKFNSTESSFLKSKNVFQHCNLISIRTLILKKETENIKKKTVKLYRTKLLLSSNSIRSRSKY